MGKAACRADWGSSLREVVEGAAEARFLGIPSVVVVVAAAAPDVLIVEVVQTAGSRGLEEASDGNQTMLRWHWTAVRGRDCPYTGVSAGIDDEALAFSSGTANATDCTTAVYGIGFVSGWGCGYVNFVVDVTDLGFDPDMGVGCCCGSSSATRLDVSWENAQAMGSASCANTLLQTAFWTVQHRTCFLGHP